MIFKEYGEDNMKEVINEFIEPDSKEKEELWKKAIFVFDTNILLNLYRYSKDTRETLFGSLEYLKERIWLPYQVVYEFMTDRYKVIFETVNRYDTLKHTSENFIKEIRETLRLKSEDQNLKSLKQDIEKWIEDRKENDLIVTNPSNDDILNRILKLFEGKVGRKYKAEELNDIYKDGRERYDKLIPPGYKDDNKNSKAENRGYGDLIIWKQILEYSQNEKKSIVFVTNDQKDDWWNIVKGKTIGPRIELRREFYSTTNQKFLMYTMNSFIEYMNTVGNQSISKKVLNEIQEYEAVKMDENLINKFQVNKIKDLYVKALNDGKDSSLLEKNEIYKKEFHKIRMQYNLLLQKLLLNNSYNDEQKERKINDDEI